MYVCMYVFRHHKKVFKIQIKRMATIRYYIIKQLCKRRKENIPLDRRWKDPKRSKTVLIFIRVPLEVWTQGNMVKKNQLSKNFKKDNNNINNKKNK